jgi:hypothetical protein
MDYLNYFRNKPVFQKTNFDAVSCKTIAKTYKKNKTAWNGTKLTPEHEAIQFYMGNHAYSELVMRYDGYQPLGDAQYIAKKYTEDLMVSGVRMFYYLLLICTRESRHVHTDYDLISDLKSKFDGECTDFTDMISGSGSSGSVKNFIDTPPDTDIASYTAYLVEVFNRGGFGGGYGGKPWGAVAKCLSDYCNGVTTMEMMMDTAWTLAHNNGPIFNKGIIFDMYDDHWLKTILDVQRSGQIPQYVAESHIMMYKYVNPDHKQFLKEVLQVVPSFGGYVDWHKVEALGAVQTYAQNKKNQINQYGMSDFAKNIEANKVKILAAEYAKEAETKAAADKQNKDFLAGSYVVTDGVYIKKLTRMEVNDEQAA